MSMYRSGTVKPSQRMRWKRPAWSFKTPKETLENFVLTQARVSAHEAMCYTRAVKKGLQEYYDSARTLSRQLKTLLSWFPQDKETILRVARQTTKEFRAAHPDWFPPTPQPADVNLSTTAALKSSSPGAQTDSLPAASPAMRDPDGGGRDLTFSRGGAEAARLAHNQEVDGAIPSPATDVSQLEPRPAMSAAEHNAFPKGRW